MKRFCKLTATSLILVMMLSGCSGASAKGGPEGMPGGMAAEETSTAVEVCTAKKDTITEYASYSGVIEPMDTVDVVAKQSGLKVTAVNYKVGEKVEKGAVLFTLETTDIENNIAVLNANQKTTEASIRSAQTNLELANGSTVQAQIASNQSSLDSAALALDTAQTDYENGKQLFAAGGISQTDLDALQKTYDNAVLSYNQAKTNYDILVQETVKENTRKAEDSLNSAQASLQSITAQRAIYQQDLADCTVTAPISGVVQECNVTEGAVLSGGTPFVLVNLDTVKIVVNISENMVTKVSAGDTVEISVPSYSEEAFQGKVSTVAPGANSDGTYDVTIEVDNKDGALKAGMFAQADFVKNRSDQSIVLERNAVVSDSQGDYVFVVNEDDTVTKLEVETGIDTGEEIEILSGVATDMEIVTSGNTYLSDGDKVHIVTEEESVDTLDENSASSAPSDTAPQDGKKEESIDAD